MDNRASLYEQIPGVLTEQRMVKEDVREGQSVPHPPHGWANHRQAPGDLLLLQGQEPILVSVDGQVTYNENLCLDWQYKL